MTRTLPEAKRAKRNKRRNAKRKLKKDRAQARDHKYAFERDLLSEVVQLETETVDQDGAQNTGEVPPPDGS